ncbi:DUF4350 domain-containing protein [Pseudomonas sp. nanlin1]|uniref:DUF4350 domain-containing protein n=1 Tax=Pseudomonas sp. nanlin1 TaxID=3040605 RepID=UPI00388FB13C
MPTTFSQPPPLDTLCRVETTRSIVRILHRAGLLLRAQALAIVLLSLGLVAAPTPSWAGQAPPSLPTPRLTQQSLDSATAQRDIQALLQQPPADRLATLRDRGSGSTGFSATPYLAALAFLQQRGLVVSQTQGLNGLNSLAPQGRSLLLLDEREGISPAQIERLLSWVSAGGRLVVAAQAQWNDQQGKSADLLLDRLRLRRYLTRDLPPAPAELTDQPFAPLTQIYLEHEPLPAYASFNPAFHLEDPYNLAQFWANSSSATHLMQLRHGLGLVTVVSDAQLWRDTAIGDADNAWLLWYLNQGSAVVLLTDISQGSGFASLLRNFSEALCALALLLGFGLWHYAWRPGPKQSPRPQGHPARLQALYATAQAQYRHGGQATLLRTLQQDILRQARRHHPGFERLAVAEQWQVLGRASGLPTRQVGQLLAPTASKRLSGRQFSDRVGHLQILRRALRA